MKTEVFDNDKIEILNRFVHYTDMHIFLTGKAGTGKTTFLKNLAEHTFKRMVIVAPTGVAAINAGGVTVHSFFQLSFGPQIPDDVEFEYETYFAQTGNEKSYFPNNAVKYNKFNRTKIKIIRSLDLLVIDEISMMRADLLDAVDAVLRKIRHNEKAFGGVQLLMIGDIQQLAPVAKQEEWNLLQPYYKSVYFFDSHVLQKTPYICINLEHIYRQDDKVFIDILNQVRNNCLDFNTLEILNSRCHPDFEPDDKDGYITLTTHNYQADEINDVKLKALKSETLIFKANIEGVFPENSYPTKESLELKIGAQVMFVKNDPSPEKMYYNGKIGKIVAYNKDRGISVQCDDNIIEVTCVKWQNFEYSINPETKEIEEKEIGSFTQIPLKTAWAITIHKSQGLTFNKVILHTEMAFAHGQIYVALSRCTSLAGLVLKSKMSRSCLFNDRIINDFVSKMPSREPDEEKLVREEQKYLYSMILELFSFNNIKNQMYRLLRIIETNENIFGSEITAKVKQEFKHFEETVMDVTLKFARQIEFLFKQNPLIDSNLQLQERIRKASVYFFDRLNDVENLGEIITETDNKTVNESVKDILDLLMEHLYVKTACLDMCKNGFDIKKYLEVKNKKIVEAQDVKKKRKLKEKQVKEKDVALMKALMSWRERKADALNVKENQVIPKSVLINIVEKKPVTIKELKVISKFGVTRIKRFGADIINIILKFQGFEQQEFDDEESRQEMNLSNSVLKTKELLEEGLSIDEIMERRNMARSTIEGHIIDIIKNGCYDSRDLVSPEHRDTIREYFTEINDSSLSAAKDVLGEEYSYFELKVVIAEMKKERKI